MAVRLDPIDTFKGLFDLAAMDGSFLRVFRYMRLRKLVQAGKNDEAGTLARQLVSTGRRVRRRADDPVAVSIATGELLGRLGNIDLAVDEYLLPAARQLIEQEKLLAAKSLLGSVLEARPDCAEAARRSEEIDKQLG